MSSLLPLSPPDILTLLQQPVAAAPDPVPWHFKLFHPPISAGFPSPAADYTDQGLDLNEFLISSKASTFFFTVVGDSMRDAGILDGDIVAVNRALTPKHGQIVIAVVNQEYTIKRLYKRGGVVELRPENPAYQPIRFRDCDELQIWGVVTSVVRRLAA